MSFLTDTDIEAILSTDRQEKDGSKLVLTPYSEVA